MTIQFPFGCEKSRNLLLESCPTEKKTKKKRTQRAEPLLKKLMWMLQSWQLVVGGIRWYSILPSIHLLSPPISIYLFTG